jgi:hypothetical protein
MLITATNRLQGLTDNSLISNETIHILLHAPDTFRKEP